MYSRTLIKLVLFICLSGCQITSTQSQQEQLLPLTLAEVSRNSELASKMICTDSDENFWDCRSRGGYVVGVMKIAPKNIAPFIAQIYLHPEYTTEKDLIEQGADQPTQLVHKDAIEGTGEMAFLKNCDIYQESV